MSVRNTVVTGSYSIVCWAISGWLDSLHTKVDLCPFFKGPNNNNFYAVMSLAANFLANYKIPEADKVPRDPVGDVSKGMPRRRK